MRQALRLVSRVCGIATASARVRTVSSSSALHEEGVAHTSSVILDRSGAGSLQQHMREKGFANATPNFSMDFGSASDVQNIAADIVTESATDVDLVRDLYGPWLVMTSDLQGELLIDKDSFVFYRPANGLGYGIGTMNLLSAGSVGTAFTMQLETYSYMLRDTVVPSVGVTLDVTGMVQKVTSRSSDYSTFSLVGVWQKSDPNNTRHSGTGSCAASTAEAISTSPSASSCGASGGGEVELAGQFNCAKISPWSEATPAGARWCPNEELLRVFGEIFPRPLQLDSHIKRASAAAVGKDETVSATKQNDACAQSEETCARWADDAKSSMASYAHSTERVASRAPKHVKLEKYAVGDVPGIYYIPDYVSEAEEAQILSCIKHTPPELKTKIKKRTVQEWGCAMCDTCKQSFVHEASMPLWVQQCNDMLVYDGLFTPTTFPNSVRIHEYEKGEGIGPHCDGPIYVPMVTVLSLASTSVMNFYPRRAPYAVDPMEHYNDTFHFAEGEIGKQTPIQSVVMEPRSLLVFSGEAYYYYPHGVSDREVDSLLPEHAGAVVNRHLLREKEVHEVRREYRVSITTRNLLTRCGHQPTRAEYGMKRAWYMYNQLPVPSTLFPPPTPGGAPVQENEVTPSTLVAHPDSISESAAVDGIYGTSNMNTLDARKDNHWVKDCPPCPPSASQLRAWEVKLDDMLAQQRTLSQSVNELREAIASSAAADLAYRSESSVVLNHLSSSILDLDAKVSDIVDDLQKKDTSA